MRLSGRLLAPFVLATTLQAQTLQPLVSAGDPVAGVGTVERLSPPFADVLDSGSWMLALETDLSDASRDQLLLRDGVPWLQEGASLLQPSGALVSQFLSCDAAEAGNRATILSTRLPTTTGAYWNLTRVTAVDELVEAPPFATGTRWKKLEIVKVDDARRVFVQGEVDDPSVAGTREDALVRYDLDASGVVLATTVLVTEGMLLPVLGTTVSSLTAAPTEHALAVNRRGDYLTYVQGSGGIHAVLLDADAVCAREGAPSSVGVSWRANGLALAKLGLNDFGDYVLSGALEGAGVETYLIERNGERFVRGGDVLPGYSGSPIAAGGAAPLLIANTGEVFWRVETALGEAAYMREHEPVVRVGTTRIGGRLVEALPATQHAFAVSPDGRFLLGRIAQLEGVGESSVLVDFGLVVPVPGCAANAGTLAKLQGDARVGTTFRLAMGRGQDLGALPALSFASRPSVPGSECGQVLPRVGELLLSPHHRLATVFLAPWNGVNPSTYDVVVPNDPALIDVELWAQGAFLDVTGPTILLPRPTNGLRIQIGAP